MNRFLTLAFALLLFAGVAFAEQPAQAVPAFPGTLVNSTYVYVTSYEGDQFKPDLPPEDRNAIAATQDAIQKWGKFMLVEKPEDADIILMVEGHGSEDVLAVYDAKGWPGNNFLWRMMGQGGLQKTETPLVTNLKSAFEKTAAKKK